MSTMDVDCPTDAGKAVLTRSRVKVSVGGGVGLDIPEVSPRDGQFYKICLHRLANLKPVLRKACEERYPGVRIMEHLLKSHDATDDRVIIFGTLFKKMQNKPAALHEFV